MWCIKTQLLSSGALGAVALDGAARMTFSQVISLWRDDESFAAEWVTQLAAIPFDAYCFETPPLTTTILNESFECVFIDSPALAWLEADPRPFQEHFRESAGSVAFPSLGKDALLVAPCPVSDSTCYTHLACFLRSATRAEAHQLWREVAQGLDDRLAGTLPNSVRPASCPCACSGPCAGRPPVYVPHHTSTICIIRGARES